MEQKQRLFELDSLRGLASLSVVLFHFTINGNKGQLGWEFSSGVTGVDIFFMISGFVICLTANRVKKWQDFVLFRFARLYPAYWSCLLITATVMYYSEPGQLTFPQFAANVTMFPTFFGIENLDGSYWTLLVELVFYFWILVLLLTGILRNIVQIGFVTILALLPFHFFSPYYRDFYHFISIKIQLINHFPLFFSGILFFQLSKGDHVGRNLALLLFSLLSSFYLHDKGGRAMHHISFVQHCTLITLFHLTFAMLVTGKLGFLKYSPLIFLGKISYCLYLIHQYVGTQLIRTFTESLQMNVYAALLITICICIAVASSVTFLIEVPANAMIRKWYAAADDRHFGRQNDEIAVR